jgi:hypothetical protein
LSIGHSTRRDTILLHHRMDIAETSQSPFICSRERDDLERRQKGVSEEFNQPQQQNNPKHGALVPFETESANIRRTQGLFGRTW